MDWSHFINNLKLLSIFIFLNVFGSAQDANTSSCRSVVTPSYLQRMLLYRPRFSDFDQDFIDRVKKRVRESGYKETFKEEVMQHVDDVIQKLKNKYDPYFDNFSRETAIGYIIAQPDFVKKMLSIPDIDRYINRFSALKFLDFIERTLYRNGQANSLKTLNDFYDGVYTYEGAYRRGCELLAERIRYFKKSAGFLDRPDVKGFLKEGITLDGALSIDCDNKHEVFDLLNISPEILDSLDGNKRVYNILNERRCSQFSAKFKDYVFDKFVKKKSVNDVKEAFRKFISDMFFIQKYERLILIQKFKEKEEEVGRDTVLESFTKVAYYLCYDRCMWGCRLDEDGDMLNDIVFDLLKKDPKKYYQPIVQKFIYIQTVYLLCLFEKTNEKKCEEILESFGYLEHYNKHYKDNDLCFRAIINELVDILGPEKVFYMAIAEKNAKKNGALYYALGNSKVELLLQNKKFVYNCLDKVKPGNYVQFLIKIAQYHYEFVENLNYILLLKSYKKKFNHYGVLYCGCSRFKILEFRDLVLRILNNYKPEFRNNSSKKFFPTNIIKLSGDLEALYRESRSLMDKVKDIGTFSYDYTSRFQEIIASRPELAELA